MTHIACQSFGATLCSLCLCGSTSISLWLTSLAAVTLLASSSPLSADDLPPLTLPQGVGVNIHFTTGHERDLDLIAAAGFKVVRMDFTWSSIERGEANMTGRRTTS